MASVIVVNKNSSREVALDRSVSVIGRDGGVAVELGDLQVSRRHALLVQARAGFFVKDLGSRNGLTLNQQRLASRTQAPIRNGDVLAMGRTTLIFKDLGPDAEEDIHPTVNATVIPAGQAPSAEPLELEPEPEEVLTPEPSRPPRKAPPPRRKRASERIPRALAPQGDAPAPVFGGQAEILALRALVERSERDRVYYRNLSLVLFGLLVLTLIVVFLWALLQTGESERAEVGQVPVENSAPAPRVKRSAALERLDAAAFAAHVQPVLSERCVSCHDGVGRGGLALAASSDAHTVDANLAAASRYVVPGAPEQSPLLLAPLGEDEGGTAGACGAVLRMESAEWQTMRDWVAGAAAVAPRAPRAPAPGAAVSNQPPTARIDGPQTVVVGDTATLSAEGSQDPEGAGLGYRWTLLEAPPRSTASLSDAESSRAQLAPDAPGRYLIALVVRDGSATGSVEHTLVAEAGAPAPDPRRSVRLDQIAQGLLGRGLTPAEHSKLEGKAGQDLRAFFLDKDEVYRRWWDAELHYLGLTGTHRPAGQPWDSLPGRLQSRRYTVQNAYYALLVGQDWSARYPGRDAYVGAVLEKVLGPDKAKDAALIEAGRRLYDGNESTLLGKRTKGQIGLVKVAVGHPQAKRHFLRRSYRALTGGEPSQQILSKALDRLQKEPASFFSILVDWSCAGL